MEKQQMAYLMDSPLQFMPMSEKQIQSNNSKIKNTSSSTHRRIKECSSSIMQRIKKISHTHKNSTVRKIKNKCETEAHQSIKKRNTEQTSLSKKTLRKRKNTRVQENGSKLKLSHSKYQQEALTLKSSVKRASTKKEMFHSTCFSRNQIDLDLDTMDQFMHGSSDLLQQSNQSHLGEISNENSLKYILERANSVFSAYKNKCQQLQKSCNFYKNELEIVTKKLQKFETINSRQGYNKSKSKPKQRIKQNKDSLRNTYSSKISQY